MVEVLGEDGSIVANASAVMVGPDQVVTNKHVVTDGITFRVKRGARSWSAVVTHLDNAHDLSLLRVPGLEGEPVKLRESTTLKVGERVYALGAPAGLELSLSDGLLSGIRIQDQNRVIQTNAAISPGSSGGGLFDSRGYLVGVTTFYLEGTESLNFALPAEQIRDLQEGRPKGNATDWMILGYQLKKIAIELEEAEAAKEFLQHGKEVIERRGTLGRTPSVVSAWARAARAYRAAAKLALRNPGSSSGFWLESGDAYSHTGDRRWMEASYNEVLRLDPDLDDSWVFGQIGDGYSRVGAYDEALKAYRKALRFEPNDARLWVGIARTYWNAHEDDQATKALQDAERLKSGDANTWESIGFVYGLLGKTEDMYRTMRESIRLKGLKVRPEH